MHVYRITKPTLLFLVSFLFCALLTKAQFNVDTKRANFWYFGQGAGIDWTSGSPVAITNGQTNSLEGAASISDANGNLLFYSDGNTIWNKNHVPMVGGNDLLGCDGIPAPIHVSQNAIIIPQPANDSLYYLFHLGCLDFTSYTLKYTIINAKLDGGNGAVISANNSIMTTKQQSLAACRHADGCSVWIVGMDTEMNFNFFKLDKTGINTTPIKQFSQLQYNNFPTGATANIKFSNDLKMMAHNTWCGLPTDTMTIYKFNNANATLSDVIKIEVSKDDVYGLHFSPDNTKLYTGRDDASDFKGLLCQYDLSTYTQTAINSSKTIIYQDSLQLSHMQTGLDGKIYIARATSSFVYGNDDSLAVIENPNAKGLACSFKVNSVYLEGKKCRYSLPNFDQGYFYPQLIKNCPTGINEVDKSDLTVYPNPFSDFIEIKNPYPFALEAKLYNLNNIEITSKTVLRSQNNQWQLNELPQGIYLLNIINPKTQEKINYYKLIKN